MFRLLAQYCTNLTRFSLPTYPRSCLSCSLLIFARSCEIPLKVCFCEFKLFFEKNTGGMSASQACFSYEEQAFMSRIAPVSRQTPWQVSTALPAFRQPRAQEAWQSPSSAPSGPSCQVWPQTGAFGSRRGPQRPLLGPSRAPRRHPIVTEAPGARRVPTRPFAFGQRGRTPPRGRPVPLPVSR